MRVLCSVTGAPSHAREMIPLACALRRAGHEVLVACVPQLVEEFTTAGLPVIGALPDQTESWTERLTSGEFTAPGGTGNPGYDQVIKVVAGRSLVERGFPALRRIAGEFAPDLLLRDGMEFCGCLVAEDLGIPHVATPSGAVNTLDPAAVAPLLNQRRIALRLGVQEDPLAIYRHGRIDSVPARYSFAASQVPRAVAYQQPETAGRRTSLPAWISALDPGKPLIYGAIGAALPMAKTLRDSGLATSIPADPFAALSTMIGALSEIDCAAVVSTGGVPVPGVTVPDHVRLVDHVPQPLLLQAVQLFLTHGGYNSVREAMRAGVPMVVTPLFGDQLDNARKVSELGLGEQVTGSDAMGTAAICRKVLDDPEITARARHAQRELLALPQVDEIVPRLEALAESKSTLESIP